MPRLSHNPPGLSALLLWPADASFSKEVPALRQEWWQQNSCTPDLLPQQYSLRKSTTTEPGFCVLILSSLTERHLSIRLLIYMDMEIWYSWQMPISLHSARQWAQDPLEGTQVTLMKSETFTLVTCWRSFCDPSSTHPVPPSTKHFIPVLLMGKMSAFWGLSHCCPFSAPGINFITPLLLNWPDQLFLSSVVSFSLKVTKPAFWDFHMLFK